MNKKLSQEQLNYRQLKDNETIIIEQLTTQLNQVNLNSNLFSTTTSKSSKDKSLKSLHIGLTNNYSCIEVVTQLQIIFTWLSQEDFAINIYTSLDSLNFAHGFNQLRINELSPELKFADLVEINQSKLLNNNTIMVLNDFYTRHDGNWYSDISIIIGKVAINTTSNIIFYFDDNMLTIKYQAENSLLIEKIYQSLINLQNISDKFLTIQQLPLLSNQVYQQLVYDWNNTVRDYPADKTIQQLFEEQVDKTPNNIAVVYENIQLTYAELNTRANQLAHYLREAYHIQGDDLVALCLERSELMLVAILGVLKAGGAYVPLDPLVIPVERVSYVLSDTKAKVLIANEVNADKLVKVLDDLTVVNNTLLSNTTNQLQLELIDSQYLQTKVSNYSAGNPQTDITSNNLAYVIYTSGTTGKPKGVMIEHNSALNTIYATKYLYIQNNQLNKVTFFTSYVFDVSVSEIFTNILFGNELHILSNLTRIDILAIEQYLLTNNINICYLPPVLLSQLSKTAKYDSLEKIIYAGEPCDVNTGTYWSNNKQLYNYYGPTECSIYCLGKQVINGDIELIGKPISNTSAYILNNQLQPLPIGAIGELYIGGAGLARGYLNLPELTSERFIANPFQTTEQYQQGINSRLYKTGDLVRYLPSGNIEYIGRNDFQVKIRGFRIELGEIENQLAKLDGVKQAVVLADDQQQRVNNSSVSHNKYLVGYYTAESPLDDNILLNKLSKILPDYMLPVTLVYLKMFPLTINGKINYKLLPNPILVNKNTHVAPTTELEMQICNICDDVLNLPVGTLGINNNFFKCGGDSISAYKVISKLDTLGYYITFQQIIDAQDIKSLALLVTKKITKGMYDDFFEQFAHEYIQNEKDITQYNPNAKVQEHIIDTPLGKVWSEIAYIQQLKNQQAMIFVQGGPSGSHDYLRTLTKISNNFPIIFFDQIGGGRSEIPQNLALCNIKDYSQIIYHIIKYYGFSRVNIFADCLGTMVAITFAKNYPDLVNHLILSSPIISIDHHYKDILSKINVLNPHYAQYIHDIQIGTTTIDKQKLIQIDKEFSDIYMLSPKFYNSYLLDTFKNVNKDVALYMLGNQQPYYKCNGSMSNESVAELMPYIKAKTMIILGDLDMISDNHLDEILRLMPYAKVRIFQNCAHWPHIEQTEQLIASIVEFIKN